MRKFLFLLLILGLVAANVCAQELTLTPDALNDDATLAKSMPELAKRLIAIYQEPDRARRLGLLFRLQIIAGQYPEAIKSLQDLSELRRPADPVAPLRLLPFEVEARARLKQSAEGIDFNEAFRHEFRSVVRRLTDLEASDALPWFGGDLKRARNDLDAALQKQKGKDRIALADALALVRAYHLFKSFEDWFPLTETLKNEEDSRRYIVERDLLIRTPDGAHISALVFRSRSVKTAQPALLAFTIYAGDELHLTGARKSAAHGYAGMIAFTRGKARSPQEPVPFERDGDDARAVIDWIIKQSWSDGRVGMYSGSYDGFTQWAAAKRLHPALKTIVPSRATNPGNGLPMENNVFLLVNYAWAFYTTNNKYLDNETYSDSRWNDLNEKWYKSGASYRKVDSIDGTSNKWFQRWLEHPSYDKYWQDMVPFREEFARINIPILTITGYYDDTQQSALWYLREHYKYNPRANHYLLIGPYDHFSTDRSRKDPILRGYALDPVAQFDTQELIFQWMDHIFRGAKRPALLKDKINYQVMGGNEWKHAPSLEKMSNETLTLFFTEVREGDKYRLLKTKPGRLGFLEQTVDFSDRKTYNNNDYYPLPIVGLKPNLNSGFAFISEPFDQPIEVSGLFSGQLKVVLNKKDVDVGVTLYEVMPNGELFHLSYFVGRASYANDMSKRQLLTAGKVELIPFDRTRLVSRKLSKGSRLLVTLDVNKHAYAQINYGTGKDVSDEDINDAKVPLKISWRNDSYLKIPMWKTTNVSSTR